MEVVLPEYALTTTTEDRELENTTLTLKELSTLVALLRERSGYAYDAAELNASKLAGSPRVTANLVREGDELFAIADKLEVERNRREDEHFSNLIKATDELREIGDAYTDLAEKVAELRERVSK